MVVRARQLSDYRLGADRNSRGEGSFSDPPSLKEDALRFIGVDPGANFTGVAILNENGDFEFHGEYSDLVDVWHRIDWNYDSVLCDDIVVLEDFVGGGQRDAYVTRTIKAVGYLETRCHEEGYTIILVNPQARLANVDNVPKEITGKDEIAAAAHALSERERRLKCTVSKKSSRSARRTTLRGCPVTIRALGITVTTIAS